MPKVEPTFWSISLGSNPKMLSRLIIFVGFIQFGLGPVFAEKESWVIRQTELSLPHLNDVHSLFLEHNLDCPPLSSVLYKDFCFDNNEGLLVDLANGLKWSVCLAGTVWEDGVCVGEPVHITFLDVQTPAQRYIPPKGWRYPTVDELFGLYRYRQMSEDTRTLSFLLDGNGLWSSSFLKGVDGYAWYLDLATGLPDITLTMMSLNARLVMQEYQKSDVMFNSAW